MSRKSLPSGFDPMVENGLSEEDMRRPMNIKPRAHSDSA
jgi:hypothetical protein